MSSAVVGPAGGRRRPRPRVSVGQRLFLGLLPSLLALVLVVALSYYGEYARQAPGAVVAGAGALALASLAVTWRNTRYLAARVGRLAGRTDGASSASRAWPDGTPGSSPPGDVAPEGGAPEDGADEFDRIERTVDRLGTALSAAERARTADQADARVREQALLLAGASEVAIRRLDDVRLPLHILLDAHFGELTPNQEELLADARDAAAAADAALRRLRTLADADRGALVARREWLALDDVLRGVLPAAEAQARRRGARVRTQFEPALPRAVGDRVRLAEALALLLEDAVAVAPADGELTVHTRRERGGVEVAVVPTGDGPDTLLARRLLAVQGARVTSVESGVRVTLPLG